MLCTLSSVMHLGSCSAQQTPGLVLTVSSQQHLLLSTAASAPASVLQQTPPLPASPKPESIAGACPGRCMAWPHLAKLHCLDLCVHYQLKLVC